MRYYGFDSFIGRLRELRIFSDLLEKTSAGNLNVLMVTGAAGTGKTALAQEFRIMAEKNGTAVYSSSLREGGSLPNRNFWKNLVPGLDEKQDTAAFDACLSLYSRSAETIRIKCGESPCVLILDNMHLAGKNLLAGLSDLFDELKCFPVLPVLFYQDIPAGRNEAFLLFLSEIKSVFNTAECRLQNFSYDEVSMMLEKIAGFRHPESIVNKLIKLTDGNPLLIRVAAQAFTENRPSSVIHPEENSIWNFDIPKAAGIVIAGSLSRLTEEALYVLRAGALTGETFSINQIHMLEKRLTEKDIFMHLQESVDRGLINNTDNASQYRFVSGSLIRLAVIADIPAAVRRSMSLSFAETVEKLPQKQRDSWSLRLVEWLKYIGDSTSQGKIRFYTLKAAETAMRSGCHEEAAELYETLIDKSHQEAIDREEAEIFYSLGIAQLNGDQIIEGLKNLTRSFAWYSRRKDISGMVRILSDTSYHYSGYTGFTRYFKATLETMEEGSLSQAYLMLYYGMNLIYSTGKYKTAEKYLLRALELGKSLNNSGIIIRSLLFLSVIDYTLLRYDSSAVKIEKAEMLSSDSNDLFAVILICYGKTLIKLESGEYSAALLTLESIFEYTRGNTDNIKTGIAFYLKARLHFQTGDWAAARAVSDDGLTLCPGHLNLLFHRAVFEYSLGENEAGDIYCRRLNYIKRRTPSGPYLIHIYTNALNIIKGRLTGNTAIMKNAIPELELIAEHPNAHPFIRLRANLLSAAASVFTGDTASARSRFQALMEFRQLHLIRPYLLERVLGLAAGAGGNREEAVRHFTIALESAEKYNDLFMKAWIHFDFGISLGNTDDDFRDSKEAYFHLKAALDAAESLGLENLSSLVLREFDKKHAGKNGKTGHYRLTKREEQVLSLLATGLTNENIALQLKISAFTVANHIHSILEKTGTSNRTEAASIALLAKTIN